MLKQCLENIGEGLLHACIPSTLSMFTQGTNLVTQMVERFGHGRQRSRFHSHCGHAISQLVRCGDTQSITSNENILQYKQKETLRHIGNRSSKRSTLTTAFHIHYFLIQLITLNAS
jgi:hypothetical protein